jgi:hypothetical protein
MKRDAWDEFSLSQKNLIVSRIAATGRSYSREEQRAELLLRNSYFLKGLQRVYRLIKKANSIRGAHIYKGVDAGFEYGKQRAYAEMGRLCDRWQISQKWNAKKETLPQFVILKPRFIYDSPAHNWPYWEMAQYPGVGQEYLYLRIDPWTSREDFTSSWREARRLQRAIFGFSEKEKSNFGASLCWYDLHSDYHLSPLRVARLWIQEAAPHVRDEESFKITVREGIKRIERYIKRLTPSEELTHK